MIEVTGIYETHMHKLIDKDGAGTRHPWWVSKHTRPVKIELKMDCSEVTIRSFIEGDIG